MQTITGLFDTYEHARQAVHSLDEAGVHSADISLVSRTADDYEPDEVGDGATVGGEIGAGLGAAGGLLAGLGIVAIPGLGAVFAAGWLLATAVGAVAGAGVGAAAGSLVGALTHAGVSEPDAHVMAEKVRRGGAIVSVRVDVAHVVPATAILRNAKGADLATLREAYQREGWQRFEEERAIEEERELEVETATQPTDRTPMLPPVV